MSIFKKIIDDNIKKNIKKIVALFGDIILTAVTIMLYAVRAELDIFTAVIMILFAFKPYLTTYINLVFKGESEAVLLDNNILRQELGFQRELSEWKVQMAAIKGTAEDGVRATSEWNEANSGIKEIEDLEAK